MLPFFRKLHLRLDSFRAAKTGNVAITFALAALPMIGMVGYAVDYSRASSAKSAMQAALDSTALMLSRDAATTSSSGLNAKALDYFKAMYNRPETTAVTITATYTTTGGSQVAVNGSANVPTTFMGVVGKNFISIAGSSTSAWGSTRLRVALALDNTGSMASDGKMTALKSATKDLLTQFKNAASQNGEVYVSIIPFAKDVNVGASNYNANWLDWTEWDAENRICNGWQWGGSCFGTWVAANHNTWTGCITDRGNTTSPGLTAGYDQKVDPPSTATRASLFPPEQYAACPVAMKGLSYDWTGMNSLVDSMQPNGATNQPIGLVWAWQSLVGGGPLTVPAKDSNYTYTDVIILMSDGLNTQNRWDGNGSNTSTAVDNRMYQSANGSGTCANIKNSGVVIYTIHVNTDGDPKSTLLQNCAGSKEKMVDYSKFYMVTSASGLGTVFNQIGTSLTKLRVAR